MLTTIKVVYDHGKITLTETPPLNTKSDIIVTFLNAEIEILRKEAQKIKLGEFNREIKLPPDLKEPLVDLKDYI